MTKQYVQTIDFYIVDVFAPKKYKGNQLAVFMDLEQRLSAEEMLAITREINFAESTFIRSIEADGSFGVRMFTTEYEIPFAGHPTLGTTYIIAKELCEVPSAKITLRLKKGDIPVQLSRPDALAKCRFTMQQAQPEFGSRIDGPLLAEAIDLPEDSLKADRPIEVVDTGLPYLIVFLKDLEHIRQIRLNSLKLERFLREHQLYKENSTTGLSTSLFFVVEEALDPAHDYHTRMLVLEDGDIWEDAATGSANGCLLAYLLKHIAPEITAVVEQGYEMGRESLLYLDGTRTNNQYTLQVGGQVVPVSSGRWSI